MRKGAKSSAGTVPGSGGQSHLARAGSHLFEPLCSGSPQRQERLSLQPNQRRRRGTHSSSSSGRTPAKGRGELFAASVGRWTRMGWRWLGAEGDGRSSRRDRCGCGLLGAAPLSQSRRRGPVAGETPRPSTGSSAAVLAFTGARLPSARALSRAPSALSVSAVFHAKSLALTRCDAQYSLQSACVY